MIINIGSKNPTKIDAVSEVLKKFSAFKGAKIKGFEIKNNKVRHPKNLEQTILGAIRRAKQVFKGCQFSFGIEGGLMEVPRTKTGFMEVTVCAIYDGKKCHLGLSPACEWPKKVTQLILRGVEGSQALKDVGITNHEKVGTAEGGIWHLTKGYMTRKDLNKMAVVMALVHLENPEHYSG